MIYLDEVLKDVKSVGITGHIGPDGDCVGSALGVYNYILENMPEIETDVMLEPILPEFKFLKNSEIITDKVKKSKVYDMFIVLDCSAFDRFEAFKVCFDKAKKRLVIDHHASGEQIGDINLIRPEFSSCSELVFNTMDADKISKTVAECLYLGIIHDTGVFKYQAVTAKTMQTAGFLMEKGIDFTSIIDDTFYMRTYRQSQVMGKALLESALFCDGKCIFSIITRREMEFYGVTEKELGGIVEQLRLNDGVEVAVFVYELKKNVYKVSLRSKDYVDVCKIAQTFGGGGHVRASGFSMEASDPRDIISNIGAMIQAQM